MRRVRAVSEDEFQREAGAAFRRVFRTTDPFRAPFSERIDHRLLLFPFHLTFVGEERDALAHGAAAVGDDGFYVTCTQRLEDPPWPLDWFVPLDDIGGYGEVGEDRSELEHADPFLDNALISPRGLWGAIISADDIAVVGGGADFVGAFVDRYPRTEPQPFTIEETAVWTPPDQQVYDLLVDHRLDGTLDRYKWLPTLLEHVFGSAGANSILEEFERREREQGWIARYEVAARSEKSAREFGAVLESEGYAVEIRGTVVLAARADSVESSVLEERRIGALARGARGDLRARVSVSRR